MNADGTWGTLGVVLTLAAATVLPRPSGSQARPPRAPPPLPMPEASQVRYLYQMPFRFPLSNLQVTAKKFATALRNGRRWAWSTEPIGGIEQVLVGMWVACAATNRDEVTGTIAIAVSVHLSRGFRRVLARRLMNRRFQSLRPPGSSFANPPWSIASLDFGPPRITEETVLDLTPAPDSSGSRGREPDAPPPLPVSMGMSYLYRLSFRFPVDNEWTMRGPSRLAGVVGTSGAWRWFTRLSRADGDEEVREHALGAWVAPSYAVGQVTGSIVLATQDPFRPDRRRKLAQAFLYDRLFQEISPPGGWSPPLDREDITFGPARLTEVLLAPPENR